MLEPGTRLSHFEIVSHIGGGGMGEVYEAVDIDLGRRIAIKVLPAEATRDESRIARFVLEAKAASALNHPHIVTVYEIGRAGDEHFIAMELVEGETLRERLARGGNPRELLPLFAQVADGLAKAHAAGIAHRDLKPENVMITADGYAKILDFGLAKLVQADVSSPDEKTTARNLTEEGSVVGTLGYMSPEQLRGARVDHRTDIFACGCMLYEAFSKRQPFRGDSRVDTIHNVLHETPPELRESDVQRVASKALMKDPAARYQAARDLASDIRVLPLEEQKSASKYWRRTVAIAAVVVLFFAIRAIVRRQRARPAAATTFNAMSIASLPGTADAGTVAISGDGRYLAYTRETDDGTALIIRQLASGSEATLVAPRRTQISRLRFTPDDQSIWFFENDVYSSIPILGGSAVKMRDKVSGRVAFAPTERAIAYAWRGSVYVAPLTGGEPRRIAGATLKETFADPVWSPDGKTIATVRRSLQGAIGARLQMIRVDVPDPVAAAAAMANDLSGEWSSVNSIEWLPNGSAIIVAAAARLPSRRQILAVPIDKSDVRRVTNDSYSYESVSIDKSGKAMTAVQADRRWNIVEVPLRSSAPGKQLAEAAGGFTHLSAARDGDVVYELSSDEGVDLWLEGPGGTKQLTRNQTAAAVPAFSPDGRSIAFVSEEKRLNNIWRIDRDGGNLKQLTFGSFVRNPRWSADGKTIYCTSRDSGRARLMRVPADGGRAEAIASNYCVRPAPSPDGKTIAAVSEYTRKLGFIDAATGKTIGETSIADVDGQMRWTSDGKRLAIMKTTNGVTNVFLVDPRSGAMEQVTKFDSGEMSSFDWGVGGKTLICARTTESRRIVVIRNFGQ